jgi:hypothetical protein
MSKYFRLQYIKITSVIHLISSSQKKHNSFTITKNSISIKILLSHNNNQLFKNNYFPGIIFEILIFHTER